MYDLKNDLNDFKQRIQTLENFSKWNNMCPKYAKQQHLNTEEGKGMNKHSFGNWFGFSVFYMVQMKSQLDSKHPVTVLNKCQSKYFVFLGFELLDFIRT